MSPRVTYKSRVAEGAAWLDETLPGWWNHNEEHLVDTKTLDLCDGRMCMLGQLEGPLLDALGNKPSWVESGRGFSTVINALHESWTWAISRGFAEQHTQDYAGLTRAWKTEIRRRRKEAGVTP